MTLSKPHPRWKKFLTLWLCLFVAFVTLKVIFNLLVLGWIDLRKTAFLEVLLLPFGQSIVFWFVYKFDKRT